MLITEAHTPPRPPLWACTRFLVSQQVSLVEVEGNIATHFQNRDHNVKTGELSLVATRKLSSASQLVNKRLFCRNQPLLLTFPLMSLNSNSREWYSQRASDWSLM